MRFSIWTKLGVQLVSFRFDIIQILQHDKLFDQNWKSTCVVIYIEHDAMQSIRFRLNYRLDLEGQKKNQQNTKKERKITMKRNNRYQVYVIRKLSNRCAVALCKLNFFESSQTFELGESSVVRKVMRSLLMGIGNIKFHHKTFKVAQSWNSTGDWRRL